MTDARGRKPRCPERGENVRFMNVLAITQSLDPVKGGGMGMAMCDLHRAYGRDGREQTKC
jgi:hypothetical protein